MKNRIGFFGSLHGSMSSNQTCFLLRNAQQAVIHSFAFTSGLFKAVTMAVVCAGACSQELPAL